ncbi:hypothetical protein ONZ45_g3731 [Pleurotus djamor]|nr:hypothetical protein ONZ45_g3731 [Pleurotus djamor]
MNAALPTPLIEPYDPRTLLPQISEARILAHAKYLSEDIGYRTVGTYEHALADEWMLREAEAVKELCEKVVRQEGSKAGKKRNLECEVWRQQGSGSHRFDMMSKRLYKTYVNLTNIVVRISDGTPKGKEHALLVNAHLDSTLPSPGAADDALSVGVMLECMRVLVETPGWEPSHAIVFLFNHAEESLQDGSQMYSTQHPTASTVRAAINLEAAGTTGRELLFQATSEEMIQAYSQVPRPFGTVLANEIFSSGVLLSDTDFRQFEEYLNVTGLDMAVVGNSYLYHMRKDLVENIQAGVAQHMGENSLSLIRTLSSPSSPLPKLTNGYTHPETVFFAHSGVFFMYSFKVARILYAVTFAASVYGAIVASGDSLGDLFNALRALGYAAGGTILVPNVVAASMQYGLAKGMSWFSSEYSTLLLFGPPALLGAISSQLLLPRGSAPHEKPMLHAILLTQSFLALVFQVVLNLGSGVMFFLSAAWIGLTLLINGAISSHGKELPLWVYAFGQIMPLLTNVQVMMPTLEVFVPLTGRLGAHVPADNVIATIVSFMSAQALPLVLPFIHRFADRTGPQGDASKTKTNTKKVASNGGALVKTLTRLLVGVTALSMGIFAIRNPFDEMHQKRVFVLHLENITSQEQHLHIAAADAAPGFEDLVRSMAKTFAVGEESLSLELMHDHNPDWAPLYPFSAFLTPYKVDLAIDPQYVSPWASGNQFTVQAVNDVVNLAEGTRSLTLKIYHPGVIWTVVAFDAHVLRWTLDGNPPDEYARHHIKEASFYGIDTWSVDLVIKIPTAASLSSSSSSSSPYYPPPREDGTLKVDFIGIQEKGMWPGKKSVKAQGGAAMVLFEELDGWLEKETGGRVDATLLGSSMPTFAPDGLSAEASWYYEGNCEHEHSLKNKERTTRLGHNLAITSLPGRMVQLHRKTVSNEQLLRCQCSTGRNLVVGLDGTTNKFNEKHTNVVALYRLLEKLTSKQLTWYNSGIGTFANTSWSILASLGKGFTQALDSVLAFGMQENILRAYEWLSDNYQDGDRIFIFGFSRGAYQARALSAMIDKAGLLPRGNTEQILYAYEHYKSVVDVPITGNPQSATPPSNGLCSHFKTTFSRQDVRVHFVGVWDSVSSIGLKLRRFPGVEDGMGHVCVFRHALALDECRVKFQPAFANGDTSPSGTNYKEVWFSGVHLDVGGKNSLDLNEIDYGPALRWMLYEAVHSGLLVKRHGTPWSEVIPPKPSLPLLTWGLVEALPLPRPTYKKAGESTMKPHMFSPRLIQPQQSIHESVFVNILEEGSEYIPLALLPHGKTWSNEFWKDLPSKDYDGPRDPRLLEELSKHGVSMEFDPYLLSKRTLNALRQVTGGSTIAGSRRSGYSAGAVDVEQKTQSSVTVRVALSDEKGKYRENETIYMVPYEGETPGSVLNRLTTLSTSDSGMRALSEVPGATDKLLSALQTEQRQQKPRIPVITVLLRIIQQCPPPKVPLRRSDGLHELEKILERNPSTKGAYLTDLRKVISLCVDPLIAGPIDSYDTSILQVALVGDQEIFISSASKWSTLPLTSQIPNEGKRVGNVSCVALSPKLDDLHGEASKIAFATRSPPKIMIWDRVFEELLGEGTLPDEEEITSLAFSPGAHDVIIFSGSKYTSSNEGNLRVWRLEAGKLVTMTSHRVTSPVTTVSPVRPTGDSILALLKDGSGTIMDWHWRLDIATSRPLKGLAKGSITTAAFSSNGKYVAVAGVDNLVRVLAVTTGMEVMQPRAGHNDRVSALVFSPDGAMLASGSEDRQIILWDSLTGDPTGVLDALQSVKSVAFSSDGGRIVSGLNDGTINVWDIGVWLMTGPKTAEFSK